MIKRILKSILPPLASQSLKKTWGRISLTGDRLAGALINTLPGRTRLFLKSRICLTRRMDFSKRDIYLYVDSDIEYDTRLRSCAKEPEMEEWFGKFFKEGDVFFDIGANVGSYSLMAAKLLDGRIKVYAFEPGFLNYAQLNRNIYLNGCQDCVTALPVALSDGTALSTFNYSNLTCGGANHALGDSVDYKGDAFSPVFRQLLLSYRLDDLVELFHLPYPQHIKIDVDGIEFSVLKGAEKILGNSACRSLMLEINEGGPFFKDTVAFLSSRGLMVHAKYKYNEGGDGGPVSLLFNYLFLKK